MKRRKPVGLPRRNVFRKKRGWCIFVAIGEDRKREEIDRKIYFAALNGGMAKAKAFGKLQGFVHGITMSCTGSPPIEAVLKCISRNNGCPTYTLRKGRAYLQGILTAKRPSQLFVTM